MVRPAPWAAMLSRRARQQATIQTQLVHRNRDRKPTQAIRVVITISRFRVITGRTTDNAMRPLWSPIGIPAAPVDALTCTQQVNSWESTATRRLWAEEECHGTKFHQETISSNIGRVEFGSPWYS